MREERLDVIYLQAIVSWNNDKEFLSRQVNKSHSLAAPERTKREADPLPIFGLPELPSTSQHGFLRESGSLDGVFQTIDQISASAYFVHPEDAPVAQQHKPSTGDYPAPTEEYKPPKEEYWQTHEEYGPPHEEYGPPHEEYGPPAVPQVRIEEPATTTEHICPTQDYQSAFVPSPPEIRNFPLPDVPAVAVQVKNEIQALHETYGPPAEPPVLHEVYGPPAVPIVEEPVPVVIAPEPPVLAPLPKYVPPATTAPPPTPKLYPYAAPVTVPEVKSEIPVLHEVYGPPVVPVVEEPVPVVIAPEPPVLAPLPEYVPPATTAAPPTPKLYPYAAPVTVPEVKSEIPVVHEVYGPPVVPIVEEPVPVVIAPEPPVLAPLPEYVPPATTAPPPTPKLYPYAAPVTVPETTIIPEVKSEIPVVHEVYGPPVVPFVEEPAPVVIAPDPPVLAPLPKYVAPVTTTLPPYVPPVTTTLPPPTAAPKLYPYPPPVVPEITTLPPAPETTLPPVTAKLLPYPPPRTSTTTTTEPTTARIEPKKAYAAKVYSKYEDTHHSAHLARSKRHLKKKWVKPVVIYKVKAVPTYHYVKAYPNVHHY
ncbi:uncharacterized protein [Chironomus tepperi]|uniref:uncharacterized protein n=1 Tax=Chironomus tepperi TaxID=113505 RepID=UPI00391F0F4B